MSLLLCQKNSYQRRLEAEVRSIKREDRGVWVELSDTILYPEGGGQPSDYGRLDHEVVLDLRKSSDGVVWHLVEDAPWGLGDTLEISLDWERRFDHMQQHSAQHLLSAIAEDVLKRKTLAFHLGPERSDIEFSGPPLRDTEVLALERLANEAIRSAHPVRTLLVTREELQAGDVRTRGIPETIQGPIRLIEIQGLDLNTCGGTHVNSTAALQAIKVVATEGRRDGTRLFYVAGGRLLKAVEDSLEHRKSVSLKLSCGPEEHVGAIERLQSQLKEAHRQIKQLNIVAADATGRGLAEEASGRVVYAHREGADMRVLRSIATAAREVNSELILFLTAGQAQGVGVFFIEGDAAILSQVGPQVAECLKGRGGGANGRFQGKAQDLSGASQALELLKRACGS